LRASEVTREVQNGRYRAGVASMLELLDAENLEQQARRRRIEAERDHYLAGARLLWASGRIDALAN
jgi:outer membrane protein TolC